MPDEAQLPLRYLEMLRHLQEGGAAPTGTPDPAAQGLAADKVRALLTRPPRGPDVERPKQGPLSMSEKALALVQGLMGLNEPERGQFQDEASFQTAARPWGGAQIASMLIPAVGAVKAARGIGAGEKALTAGEEVAQTPAMIKAYHGSPHDFEKFDASKIGTGEGNRARGTGHYFSAEEGIARTYKPEGTIVEGGVTALPDAKLRVTVTNLADDGHVINSFQFPSREEADVFVQSREYLKQKKQYGYATHTIEEHKINPGRMYEVNIKADPEHFLDWDRPLNEQSPHVQAAIERLPMDYVPGLVERTASGGALVDAMSRNMGPQEGVGIGEMFSKGPHPDVSKELKDAGIVGTKYSSKDARGVVQGTNNYLIYPGNEHLIEIMRKYGVALPVAAEIYRRQQAQSHEPGASSSTPFTLSR